MPDHSAPKFVSAKADDFVLRKSRFDTYEILMNGQIEGQFNLSKSIGVGSAFGKDLRIDWSPEFYEGASYMEVDWGDFWATQFIWTSNVIRMRIGKERLDCRAEISRQIIRDMSGTPGRRASKYLERI